MSENTPPNKNPLGITDVVLRDGSQSLLATRVRIEDMLPIAEKLDQRLSQPQTPSGLSLSSLFVGILSGAGLTLLLVWLL